MSANYTSFGNFLLLKGRTQDGLGSLWRAGEMERAGFKRIVWLRRFDQTGLNRTAIAAEVNIVNQLSQSFRANNVARSAVAGSEGGVPFLAWDYVPSQPLDQLLVRVKDEQFPVAIDNALLIAEKLAAALSAALAVEVRGEPLVHGFLVPQMVLVGNDGEATVAGFGIARGLLANLDRVGVQQLAAPYLAPEVLASATASKRSDVYSLGAILFQLLTGNALPAEPGARAAALQSPQLALEEGPVPADVTAILQKSLAARPEDRFPSAAEFKRELEKLLYGGAYSPTTFNLALFMDRLYRQEIEEEDRELQREKSLDVTPYYRPTQPAEAASAPQPAAPATSRTGLYIAIAAVVVLVGVIGVLLLNRPAAKSVMDEAAQKALVQQIVQEELAKKEAELRAELDKEKAKTAEMQRQLEETQAAAAKPKTSPEEQARAEQRRKELAAQLAAQEAEQRRKEEELRKIQQQKAEALKVAAQAPATPPPAAAVPSAAPVAAAPQPTTPPVAVAQAPEPTPVSTEAPAPPPAQVSGPVGLGTGVREGDLVDPTQVDVQPQVLTQAKPVLPRAAVLSRVAGSGPVILRALVDQKGAVTEAQVLRGFPIPRLGIDEACIDAVKQYRYKPATKDGVKVKTWVTVTFLVDLQRSR